MSLRNPTGRVTVRLNEFSIMTAENEKGLEILRSMQILDCDISTQ